MAWQKLADRINNLPLVLCGPLVRRVDSTSTTVWIALKEPRKVTLRVSQMASDLSGRVEVQKGTRSTTKLGEHLHIVAITAMGNMDWGRLYVYDLRFGQAGNDAVPVPESGTGLFEKNVLAETKEKAHNLILYENNLGPGMVALDLPSFATPPTDMNKVRLIHGSCRKPHGSSQDALQILDSLIRLSLSDPLHRPHQLFLTGDQIYADDVADGLLAMLTDAGDTLLGWTEQLPTLDGLKNPAELLPGRRKMVANKKSGISSGEAKSHLLSLGEFYAMYLFGWSEVLWPGPRWPEFADVYKQEWDEYQADASRGENLDNRRHQKEIDEYKHEMVRVGTFKSRIWNVRRALANIPAYMIMDDHEITDDWNLDRRWCEDALTAQLSRRVIGNGLLAYAVFQAWGNTPWQFASGSTGEPGRKLLAAASEWNGTENEHLKEIQLRVGVNQSSDVVSNKKLTHPTGSLDWNYYLGASVNGPPYEIIVLDTRTWRGFPGGRRDAAALISDEAAMERQLPLSVPPGEDGVTIVISPAPVLGVPLVEDIVQAKAPAPLTRIVDREAWSHHRRSLELLLSRLVQRSSRVIVLSGDVHYGFSLHMSYWAQRPFGTPPSTVSTPLRRGVVVQLTSSSLKNESEFPPTYFLHNHGYDLGSGPPEPQYLVGWHKQPFMQFVTYLQSIRSDPPIWHLSDGTMPLSVSAAPDWSYRIDYLLSEARVATPASIPIPPRWLDVAALNAYLSTGEEYEKYLKSYAPGREIVGWNNIGEVTFRWGPGDDKEVVHELWWWLSPEAQPFPISKYVVSLRLSDSRYPPPQAMHVDPSIDPRP